MLMQVNVAAWPKERASAARKKRVWWDVLWRVS